MRLWSLHPSLLDARGLVALWREGLLARAVLAGQTRGYRHHPQLERFRGGGLARLDCYLSGVLEEATARGYTFDGSKIRARRCASAHAEVAIGQLEHEWRHLLAKLRLRDRARWYASRGRRPLAHPCFEIVPGSIAAWERRPAGA